MSEGLRVKVVEVTPSPMNPLRWLLDLECGHELWVTSRSRPVRTTATCPKHETKEEAR